jgi:ribosomal protein S18 acetylase RimI-like enzyme
MKIRRLQLKDLGQIVAMVHDVMGPEDAKKALKDMKVILDIEKTDAYKFQEFYVMEIEGDIVAAGGFWGLHYDPPMARMDWFVVPRKHQRKGFGTMMIKYLEGRIKRKKLRMILAETSSSRAYAPVVDFFRKNGFVQAGHIPNYWEDGSGALYLVKRL